MSGLKKSIKFRFSQPEFLLSPTANDQLNTPQQISFPSGAYVEQLNLCNGMLDVESRKREVAVVVELFKPKKKAKTGTTASATASISTAEDNHDDESEEEEEEDEFPEMEIGSQTSTTSSVALITEGVQAI